MKPGGRRWEGVSYDLICIKSCRSSTYISLTTMEKGDRPGFTTETFKNSEPRSTAIIAACTRTTARSAHNSSIPHAGALLFRCIFPASESSVRQCLARSIAHALICYSFRLNIRIDGFDGANESFLST